MQDYGQKKFSPNICVTHRCNLNCVYCYQKHDTVGRMSIATAKRCIDWIFANIPDNSNSVEIDFIGGEPLLEFDLIKDVVNYTVNKNISIPYIFFATTNGTVLSTNMKKYFSDNKDIFWLGLSIDGGKQTQDNNRSNSFDKIDVDYFLKNWPHQSIKMTLSEYSLNHLYDDVVYLHSLGIEDISGANLAEGNINWDKDAYLKILSYQLSKLVEYYVNNEKLQPFMLLDKRLDLCEAKPERTKWCGVGAGTPFFDIDGKKYPCPFITTMTFPDNDLQNILKYDFNNINNFIDEKCYKECYLYPICPNCSGSNYLANKDFKIRNKNKCKIQKLVSLYIADLQAKRILKNPSVFESEQLYYTIEAIKNIKNLYLNEYKEFI